MLLLLLLVLFVTVVRRGIVMQKVENGRKQGIHLSSDPCRCGCVRVRSLNLMMKSSLLVEEGEWLLSVELAVGEEGALEGDDDDDVVMLVVITTSGSSSSVSTIVRVVTGRGG